jgi:WD40 repeat protein
MKSFAAMMYASSYSQETTIESESRVTAPALTTTHQGLPVELLFDHVCPFLDRQTFNNFLLVSKQAYQCLTADDRPTPPWPRKVVSRDHMCRIRSMNFSNDGTELACGAADGSIKVWHAWTGEQPSLRGHWPGEAVIALAYSNNNYNNDGNMLASSSTDHTIRLWKKRSLQRRPAGPFGKTKSSGRCMNFAESQKGSADSSSGAAKNITIQIRDAGHAYALMFSPDNTYLVSGHHPQQPQRQPLNQQQEQRQDDWGDERREQPPALPQPHRSNYLVPETIYLWSVATGMKLRRLENGGMPVGFLRPSLCDHRLLSTCAGESLKLWSLGGAKSGTKGSSSQCLQRLFLDGYTTVMPVPLSSSDRDNTNTVADIMVASIDGSDSFTVWNTGGDDNPKSYNTFQNASPYEIKFATNCSKVASVDNFTQVKVWHVQSGKLLKTFVQDSGNKTTTAGRCHGGFPIHEIAFCQDSTVAVVSRFYNEVHLFST